MLNILPRGYRKCEGLREKATASECKIYKANTDGSRGELIKVVTADLDIPDYDTKYRIGKGRR